MATKNLKVKAGLKTRTIRVNTLTRVEGEGSLYLKTSDGKVDSVRLKIFEPPRFFEALLRGRDFREAPDITSRICGICPVAYQLSALQAMENEAQVRPSKVIRDLRRLLLCGEWIESHALHVYMLHAPDFLGYPDAIRMAKDHSQAVTRGLQLKKVGNELMTWVGGREIHPINVRVGGFYRLPNLMEVNVLRERLLWARDAAIETVRWVSDFHFPELERDYEFVSLSHPEHYAMEEGRILSSRGLDIRIEDYDHHFTEYQVEYSNALHSVINGRGEYLTGPLARYNLNAKNLSKLTLETVAAIKFPLKCNNPYQSIIVRALEILYACDEALRLIEEYEPVGPSFLEVTPRGGTGHGCVEAPRGSLYHRYKLALDGTIEDAKIVPPTSQNQSTIERDLAVIAQKYVHLSKEELTHRCEQVIRNHDPCISCSAHFLRVEIQNG